MPDQKTICFVSLEIYPTTHGGAGILLYHTVRTLLEDNYKIILLLAIPKNEFERFQNKDRYDFPNSHNLEAFSVDALTIEAKYQPPQGISDDVYLLSAKYSAAINHLLITHAIDLIEFYDYCGPAWHWLATDRASEVKTTIRLHSTIELINRAIRAPLTADRLLHFFMERSALSAADGILSPGKHFFKESAQPLYPGVMAERVHHSPPIHRPIGSIKYSTASRDVVFYGRLSTIKGLDLFLRGMTIALGDETFSRWLGKAIIIGPEETVSTALTLDEMRRLIPDKHRGRFVFPGRVSHAELMSYLQISSFGVFANKIESFCYAAHELHTAGLPLILIDLPAFRDHFAEGTDACFFDRTADDLARTIAQLSHDDLLRARLARRGLERAPEYRVNRYAEHLKSVSLARDLAAKPIAITPLVFSNGDASLESLTLEALGDLVERCIIFRKGSDGYSVSGTNFEAVCPDGSPADLVPIGGAVIGLRAGDLPDLAWLRSVAKLMGQHPKIGVVSCWHLCDGNLKTAIDHVLADHALSAGHGLRRAIRVTREMVCTELVGQMKAAGEMSLVLASRARGEQLMESPVPGIDTSKSSSIAALDESGALAAEYDRFDSGYLALRDAAAVEAAKSTAIQASSVLSLDGGDLVAAFAREHDLNRCVIRSRPDLQAGEIWIKRVFAKGGQIATPWSSVEFSAGWCDRDMGLGDTLVSKVATWNGWMSFNAEATCVIEVLSGPVSGTMEVTHGGKSHLLNLRRPNAEDVFLRLSDLAMLSRANPVAIDPADRARVISERMPVANLAIEGVLLVGASDGWVANTSALSALGALPRLGISELGEHRSGGLSAAATLVGVARTRHLKRIFVSVDGPDSLRLLDQVASTKPNCELVAVLPPTGEGQSGEEAYARGSALAAGVLGLGRRHQGSLSLASPDASLCAVFGRFGGKASLLRSLPPTPRFRGAKNGAPIIAILDASRVAPTRGHLIATASLLRRRFPEARILLSSADRHSALVGTALGEFEYTFFAEIEEIGRHALHGPAVALAAYPDITVHERVEAVASMGFLPVTGPAPLYGDQRLSELSVSYWEDPASIADCASRAIEDWQNASERVVAAAESARQRILLEAADLIGVPVPSETGESRPNGKLTEQSRVPH